MWEAPANAKVCFIVSSPVSIADTRTQGGKWVALFRSSPPLLDASWANLTMALVGEVLDPDDEVCGIVASSRPKIDRIQVWTRGRDDPERINGLGKRIVEVLNLEGRDVEAMSMEFQVRPCSSSSSFVS